MTPDRQASVLPAAASDRARYIATVIDLGGAPVIAPVGGPQVMTIYGSPVPPALAHLAMLPYGAQVAVELNTGPHGQAWRIVGGPHAGLIVPYHHTAWSVNPLPPIMP